MPARVSKNRDGTYRVATPGGMKAGRTTKARAEAQQRLLNALDHGWKKPSLANA